MLRPEYTLNTTSDPLPRILPINRSSIYLLVFTIFFHAHAHGVLVEDLYVGEVLVVASQGDAQLAEGARAAMRQVLVRVSGSAAIESNPVVISALRNPANYYYQYGYDSSDKTLSVGGADVPARILQVSFDPGAIARLLRESGFPVWGSNRPGVLAWIAVSDGSDRRIITETDEFMDVLGRQAKVRGVPLSAPIMDIEDASKLSTAEVWGLFVDRIDVASLRYAPDVVLAGRVQRDGTGLWSGRWNYRIENRWQAFENAAPDQDQLIGEIIGILADQLATRFAVDSFRSELLVRVDSVVTLEDYADVSAYLDSLSPVVFISAVQVSGDEVVFRLQTEGQPGQLLEIIGLDTKMVLINDGARGGTVHFKWVGM